MGTDIFKTFDRLYENIKDLEINSYIFFKENKDIITVEGKNKTYNLLLNNINITPIKNKRSAALGTATQYRRMICAFGIGIVQENKYKNEKDFILNEGKI